MRKLIVCLLVALLPMVAQAADKEFRAGAAASNITPPLGELIVGGWKPFPAKNIHDELHARCLVLDDGKTKLALVVCDNVGIPREVFDSARSQITEATGIPGDHILMSATHTHSATTARSENKLVASDKLSTYQAFLARRISDGVRRAINNLQPAEIGWGGVAVPDHVFNRRWYMKPQAQIRNPFGGFDRVRMNPGRADPNLLEPAGPTDPEVSFVSVRSRDGRPIALLANYSLHYVGGVRSGDVSADYFAIFANHLGKLLKTDDQHPPFVGIMCNGTSGDINNINFREKPSKRAPYEQMTRVGRDVAQKVFAAQQKIEYRDWVPLSAQMRELKLATRRPNAEQLAYERQILAKPENAEPYHRHEKTYAQRLMRLAESPEEISVPLQTLRVGDLGIAAIPFEVFVEIGLEIKDKSPLADTFTVSLANGSYGYLPTPEQHALGGYETWMGTNNVEIEASRKISKTLLEMFEDLKK